MGSDGPGALVAVTRSPEATEALGEAIGRLLGAGDVVGLVGPLGAGKTCLARGLARGLGVEGRVASPSFIVARFHPGPTPLVHADAYRLSSPEELVEAGLDEWLRAAALVLEWADRVAAVLPADRVTVALALTGGGRRLSLAGGGPRSRALLDSLKEALSGESSRSGDLELEGQPGACA